MRSMNLSKTLTTLTTLTLSALLCACSGDEPATGGDGARRSGGAAQTPPANDHGTEKDLGELTVSGKAFRVVQLGELKTGVEGAFEVFGDGMKDKDLKQLNAYLWIESQDGTQLSAAEKGLPGGDRLHFHCTPRKSDAPPHRVVLRLRQDGSDERASLPLDGHGHEHVEGPHHGIPAAFSGGDQKGHLELKLHDDKGDLELWLSSDDKHEKPFDLPLDGTVEVEFVDVDGRKVTLRPRNTTQNEDEDGKPNIRDGKTNYFIYPSKEGEDASWLQGKKFQSIVVVRFESGEKAFVSEEFVLKPHTH